MTQAGNGHSKDVEPKDLVVFIPVFVPGDEKEPIAIYETDVKEADGTFIEELPEELIGEEEDSES